MASQRDVKNRIDSVKNIRKITRAMEMVAAARLRRAEQRIAHLRPYAGAIRRMTRQAAEAAGGEVGQLPILQQHENEQTIAILLVTADRGLAGAFNSQILRAGLRTAVGVRERRARRHLLRVGAPRRLLADLPRARGRRRLHGLHRAPGLRRRARHRRGPDGRLRRRQGRPRRHPLQRLRLAPRPGGAARDAAAAAGGDDPRVPRGRGRRRGTPGTTRSSSTSRAPRRSSSASSPTTSRSRSTGRCSSRRRRSWARA